MLADQLLETEGTTCAGKNAEMSFGETKDCGVREDAEGAGEGELEASAESDGGDSCDGGDGEGGERGEGLPEAGKEALGSVPDIPCQLDGSF